MKHTARLILAIFSVPLISAIPAASPLPQVNLPSFSTLRDMVPPRSISNTQSDLQLVDLDSDGAPELCRIEDVLSVGHNDGSGRFEPLDLGLEIHSQRIASIDVDGDDRLELAVYGDGVLWIVELPRGVPTLHYLGVQGTVASVRSLVAGDFDGDGDEDLFYASDNPLGAFSILLNNGDGSAFSEVLLSNLPAYLPSHTVVCDIDRDGDVDVVVSTNGPGPILFVNDGALGFTHLDLSSPRNSYSTSSAIGDLNADGWPDIWTGADLFLSDGSGGFDDVSSMLESSTYSSSGALLLDLDQDGDLDLVSTVFSNFILQAHWQFAFRNNGDGTFDSIGDQILPLRERIFGASAADVDGDGDGDLIVREFMSGGIAQHLWLQGADGRFSSLDLAVDPFTRDTPLGVAVLDANGDGLPDFTTYGDYGDYGATTLRMNDGTGRFREASANLNTSATALLSIGGDFDGDGDDDIIVIPNRFMENDGTGVFTLDTTRLANVGSNFVVGVAIDIDADGDLDAVGAPFAGRNLDVWVNQGDGTMLSGVASLPQVPQFIQGVVAADFDGDSLPDIFGYGAQGEVFLLTNQGALVFVDTSDGLPITTDSSIRTTDVAVGDIDGDGIADLFLARETNLGGPAPDALWFSDGSGEFTDMSSRISYFDQRSLSVTFLDEDGDGDLDIAAAEYQERSPSEIDPEFPRIRVAQNISGGFFAEIRSTTFSGSGMDLTAADVDGDGDDDLLSIDQVFYSLRRQLSWDSVPRIGQPLKLTIHGFANQAWGFGASLGRADVSIGSYGQLRIDPTMLLDLQSGVLDGEGAFTISYQIPNDPTLVGMELFGQALIGTISRFSNLEIVVLYD